MLEAIRNAYTVFEQLNISVTGVIVLAVILALAFLFAVREAATWFFKVYEVKKDVLRLREVTVQLEAEIRTLHTLISQVQTKTQPSFVAPPPAPQAVTAVSAPVEPSIPTKKPLPSQFPIVH